jgi:hypothetical protein
MDPATGRSRTRHLDERLLTYAALLYAAAFLVHTGDHFRRGLDVVTTEVVVLGSVAAALQVVAIGAVLRRVRLAPLLAVAVGLPDGLGIAAVHLLPHWSALSDAFPGAHGTGVTPLSWVAAITEVAGALLFALAGAYAIRQRGGLDALLSANTPTGMTVGQPTG